MFGSLKVATIRGIPIRLHITLIATFAILVAKLGWELSLPAVIVLLGSLLLHELGHAFVAQHYGIRIAGIDLHVLGGMALMTRPPDSPRQEVLIAAAGPGVSLVLSIVFTVIGFAIAPPAIPANGELGLRFLVEAGAILNLGMGVFNLAPALPMDGGRIFRALLQTRFGATRATRFAAWVSRAIALAFAIVAVTYEEWLLLAVSLFLLLLVANEERVVRAQEAMRERLRELETEESSGAQVVEVAGEGGARVTREEFTDPWGRRYVVITRLSS